MSAEPADTWLGGLSASTRRRSRSPHHGPGICDIDLWGLHLDRDLRRVASGSEQFVPKVSHGGTQVVDTRHRRRTNGGGRRSDPTTGHHPSPAVTTRLITARLLPPIHNGGCGVCTGLDRRISLVPLTLSPITGVDGESRMRRRALGASSNTAARSSKFTPTRRTPTAGILFPPRRSDVHRKGGPGWSTPWPHDTGCGRATRRG